MTDHSPDHAERAREVLERAVSFMRHSQLCGVVGGYDRCTCGMEEARDAALRGRDRVVEDLTTALHDAISRPAGVVPASAEPFYDWRRYDRGPVHDAKEPRP